MDCGAEGCPQRRIFCPDLGRLRSLCATSRHHALFHDVDPVCVCSSLESDRSHGAAAASAAGLLAAETRQRAFGLASLGYGKTSITCLFGCYFRGDHGCSNDYQTVTSGAAFLAANQKCRLQHGLVSREDVLAN